MRPKIRIMRRSIFCSLIGMTGLLLTSCGSSQPVSERMQENEYRSEVYQVIANNENYFKQFLEVANSNQQAQKWLLQDHFNSMQSGEIKEIVKNDPELKERMKKMMQDKMENDPEMQAKMMEKMKEKMMKDPEMHEQMMMQIHQKMKSNPQMADKMMDKMIQFLHENPELMEQMKAKMKAHQEKM